MSIHVSGSAILRQLETLQLNMAQLESTLENFEQEGHTLNYAAGQFHHKLAEHLSTELTAFEIQAAELPEIQLIFAANQEALTEQLRNIGSLLSRINIVPPSERELRAAQAAAKALEEQLPVKDRIKKLQKDVKALNASIDRGDVTDPTQLQIDDLTTFMDHFRTSADLLSKKISSKSSTQAPLKEIYTRLELMQKWYREQIAIQEKSVNPSKLKEDHRKATEKRSPSLDVPQIALTEESINSLHALLEELIQILESNRDEDIELIQARLISIDPKVERRIYSHLYQIHHTHRNIKKSHPQYGRVVFHGDTSLCKNTDTLQRDRIEAVNRAKNELPPKRESIVLPQLHVDSLSVGSDTISPPLLPSVGKSSTELEEQRALEQQRILEQERALEEQIPLPERIKKLARAVQELERRIKNAEGHGLPPQEAIAELTITIQQYRERAQGIAGKFIESTNQSVFKSINEDTIKILAKLEIWLSETTAKIREEQQKILVSPHQEEEIQHTEDTDETITTASCLVLEQLIVELQFNRKEQADGQLVILRSLNPKVEKRIYSHLYQIHHAAKTIKKNHPQHGRVVFQGDTSLCKNPSRLQQDRIEAVRRVLKELSK